MQQPEGRIPPLQTIRGQLAGSRTKKREEKRTSPLIFRTKCRCTEPRKTQLESCHRYRGKKKKKKKQHSQQHNTPRTVYDHGQTISAVLCLTCRMSLSLLSLRKHAINARYAARVAAQSFSCMACHALTKQQGKARWRRRGGRHLPTVLLERLICQLVPASLQIRDSKRPSGRYGRSARLHCLLATLSDNVLAKTTPSTRVNCESSRISQTKDSGRRRPALKLKRA